MKEKKREENEKIEIGFPLLGSLESASHCHHDRVPLLEGMWRTDGWAFSLPRPRDTGSSPSGLESLYLVVVLNPGGAEVQT